MHEVDELAHKGRYNEIVDKGLNLGRKVDNQRVPERVLQQSYLQSRLRVEVDVKGHPHSTNCWTRVWLVNYR